MAIRAIFQNWVNAADNPLLRTRSFSVQKLLLQKILSLIADPPQEPSPLERLSVKNQRLSIQTHSFLEKEIAEPVITKYTEPLPLLGSIHGDALLKGTRLENALSFKTSLRVWIGYLKSSHLQVPTSLLTCLKQLEKLCTDHRWFDKEPPSLDEVIAEARVSMHAVHQLPSGGAYLMAGRCNNTSPVLFEFEKQADNKYQLTVYLLCKDAAPFQVTVENQKRWVNPVIQIRNISPNALFFNDENQPIQPDFFQAILETQITQFSAEDIFLKLLRHLKDLSNTDVPSVTLIKEPEAHTAMWRIFKSLALKHMGKKLYQLWVAEMKVRSLVEGYQLYKRFLGDPQPAVETVCTILKTGALNTYSRLELLANSGVVDAELLKKWSATVLDLVAKIDQIESAGKEMHIPSVQIAWKPQENKESIRVARVQGLRTLAERVPEKGSDSGNKIATRRFTTFSLPPVKALSGTLQNWLEQRWEDKKIFALEMEQMVETLPNLIQSPSYWSELPDSQLFPLLKIFAQLLDKYDWCKRSAEVSIFPREANTVLSLYVLIHHLALRIDAGNQGDVESRAPLKLYPLYSPGEEDDLDPFLLLSPDEFEKRISLRNYFQKTYSDRFKLEDRAEYEDFPYEPFPLFDFADSTQSTVHLRKIRGLMQWLWALGKSYSDLGVKDNDNKAEVLCTLLPEMLKEDLSNNLFFKANLKYVPYLARAAFMARQFFQDTPMLRFERELCVHIKKKKSDSFTAIYRRNTEDKVEVIVQSNRHPSSLSIHPAVAAETREWLSQNKWNRRLKNKDTSKEEGETLIHGDPLLRASCEPILYPYKLLTYFTQNIHLLESMDEQFKFEMEFFRCVSLKHSEEQGGKKEADIETHLETYTRHTFFPLQEALKNPHFKKQCHLFIQRGVDLFCTQWGPRHPPMTPLLFFVRIGIRLNAFVDKPDFIEPKFLVSLLNREDLSLEERSLIALHLIFAYKNSNRSLSQSELEELFVAWIFYGFHPVPEKKFLPLLHKEAEKFIYFQCKALKLVTPGFFKNILEKIFEQLGHDGNIVQDSIKWIYPTIVVELEEKYIFKVDLISGQLFFNDYVVKRNLPSHSWGAGTLFHHIFGSTPPSAIQSGNTISFSHGALGECRIEGSDGDLDKGLQRKIHGIWYQYISPEKLVGIGIPHALLADHTHWVATIPQERAALLISPRASGHIVASANFNSEPNAQPREMAHFLI